MQVAPSWGRNLLHKMPLHSNCCNPGAIPATTLHNHPSLGETWTNDASRSSNSNRSMLRIFCFRPTPPRMTVSVFTCTGFQAAAFGVARTSGQSPPPRGDADKHATAHTNKVRKDTVLRYSPKVLLTSRICIWARSRVHNNYLHLGPKPCPQQVFTFVFEDRVRRKPLSLGPKPCPQTVFACEPKTLSSTSLRNCRPPPRAAHQAASVANSGCKQAAPGQPPDRNQTTIKAHVAAVGPQMNHNGSTMGAR